MQKMQIRCFIVRLEMPFLKCQKRCKFWNVCELKTCFCKDDKCKVGFEMPLFLGPAHINKRHILCIRVGLLMVGIKMCIQVWKDDNAAYVWIIKPLSWSMVGFSLHIKIKTQFIFNRQYTIIHVCIWAYQPKKRWRGLFRPHNHIQTSWQAPKTNKKKHWIWKYLTELQMLLKLNQSLYLDRNLKFQK